MKDFAIRTEQDVRYQISTFYLGMKSLFPMFLEAVLFLVCGTFGLLHLGIFSFGIIGRGRIGHHFFRQVRTALFLGQTGRMVLGIAFDHGPNLHKLTGLVGGLVKTFGVQIITTLNNVQIMLNSVRERCWDHIEPLIPRMIGSLFLGRILEGGRGDGIRCFGSGHGQNLLLIGNRTFDKGHGRLVRCQGTLAKRLKSWSLIVQHGRIQSERSRVTRNEAGQFVSGCPL